MHGAICLVDGHVGIGGRTGIGIGDGDSAERFSPDYIRAFGRRPIGVKEWVVFIPIPVRPAVHRNRLNISCRIKTSRGKNTSELVSRLAFEILEGRHQEFQAAGFVLFPGREPRLAGRPAKVQ